MYIFLYLPHMCLYSYVLQRKDIQAVLHTNPSPLLILKRFCVLGHIMQREAARGRKGGKKPIWTFSLSFTPCPASPATGVSATVAHHILNIHQRVILFPVTNATGRQQGSFQSSLKSHFLSFGSSRSGCECNWRLESKFQINICMHHMDEQEREMIGSEIGPGLKSLTMPPL